MKVLAVATPGAGHVNPMMPLIEAFLAQGDEVTVAAGEDPGGVVARAGAVFAGAGRGEMDWFADLGARVLHGLPGDGLAPERINHYFVPRLFAEVAAPDMIDDVVAIGRELGPDLVLFETYALAGPLAAEVLGVPGVHHLISPMLPHEVTGARRRRRVADLAFVRLRHPRLRRVVPGDHDRDHAAFARGADHPGRRDPGHASRAVACERAGAQRSPLCVPDARHAVREHRGVSHGPCRSCG